MVVQIIGIIAGIGIGYFVGENAGLKSKKYLILFSILVPIALWILVTFILMPIEFNNSNTYSGQWSSLNITFGEKLATSLGMALGKFFFGYIAMAITIFRVQRKKLKIENDQKNNEINHEK